MTEFDSKALSVIDKFFGDDTTDSKKAKAVPDIQHRPQSRKDHRFGVGVAPPTTSKKEVDGLNLQKRILQVGKKRGLQQQADDDEVDKDSDADDDSQEEDLGRTGIADTLTKRRKVFAATTDNDVSGSVKQTKKKDKKTKPSKSVVEVDDAAGAKVDDKSQIDALGLVIDRKGVDPEATMVEGDSQTTKDMKRKRKKVRSRQKNIYKDKREIKPEHLIPGSKNYKGKPMTAETRKKLNLTT